MSRASGRLRHILDYLGITRSAEDQQRRPVGSKAWWISTIATASFFMVALFLLQAFVL